LANLKESFLITALSLAIVPAMFAHHSLAAEYEAKVMLLNAVITRVNWMNPHVWIYFDTRDAAGTVANWECESGAPNGLISLGWRKDSLKPGDRVTVEASRSKDRPDVCKVRAVKLADGRRVLAGVDYKG
jgi:Family of unknown function (DUF6152)